MRVFCVSLYRCLTTVPLLITVTEQGELQKLPRALLSFWLKSFEDFGRGGVELIEREL